MPAAARSSRRRFFGRESHLRSAWTEFREAARAFSRPARLFLIAEFLAWTGHGVFQVLFNLYLVQGHFDAAFVGRAVSSNAIGLALAALPAGFLSDRWGRRRCLTLGAALEGAAFVVRCSVLDPNVIYASSFFAGMGQSLLAISAAPFLTENSNPKERTHLFSAYFATALLAGVVGSTVGGWLPWIMVRLPVLIRPDLFHSYRVALMVGSLLALSSTIPLSRMRGLIERPIPRGAGPGERKAWRTLGPIGLNSLLIGAGAGLVIPFMNLYFATRFHSTSGQIGFFFSVAQVFTAIASLLGPSIARRFGKLRTAIASELLSLPFLVTLGAERQLPVAVGAFWIRATLMQASTPLLQAFIMESLPRELRARSTSLSNLVWNAGWATSAALAGVIIQNFGYAVPFYVTAVLYGIAAFTFYAFFRNAPEVEETVPLSEEAKGQRGEGPFTE
jgi:MFS family permease